MADKKDFLGSEKSHSSEEEIEIISASIAHEIKNPLAIIKANLQIMEESSNDYKNLDNINKEIEKINVLIEDFLEILSPIVYEFSYVNIKSLLENVINIYKLLFDENRINLSLKICDNSLVRMDIEQIEAVLLNIFKNSVEAFDEKKEKRRIIIKSYINDELFIVDIYDNAKGISKSDIEKIKRPFYTTKEKGTGIGIYLANKVMNAHGGEYDIISEEGIGTCVSLRFQDFMKI